MCLLLHDLLDLCQFVRSCCEFSSFNMPAWSLCLDQLISFFIIERVNVYFCRVHLHCVVVTQILVSINRHSLLLADSQIASTYPYQRAYFNRKCRRRASDTEVAVSKYACEDDFSVWVSMRVSSSVSKYQVWNHWFP